MEKLTSKQNMILETIREFVEIRGENPTAYKLQKYLETQGVNESVKSIMQVTESLEKKELIRRDEDRKIYLIQSNDGYANWGNVFSVPVYGLASCGDALAYAEDNMEGFLQISQSVFRCSEPARLFAVKALGDSMDKDNINDGDYAIFEKYESQEDLEGKVIVAVINGMATIKRYKKVSSELIGLFPNSTNSFHKPIFLHKSDSILIAGIFKKVLPVTFVSL